MDFFTWSRSDPPAVVVDLRDPSALFGILGTYASAVPRVLQEILAQAFNRGAQMAVIEYRYLDPDYRNEHSRFYSTTFRRYPSVAHRLHFFADPPPEELASPDRPASFSGLNYLGYCVLRPVPGAPVGRTMLAPPAELVDCVTVAVCDEVNLLGTEHKVSAAPFIAQDAQLSRCAHASVWVTAYYFHLAFGERRLLPGDIADFIPAGAGIGRSVPSQGLNVFEMSAAFSRIGLPALVYDISHLPENETLFKIACRYLNSRIPVTVVGGGHAWVLVGYRRSRTEDGGTWISFIRQDDESGPYQVVENPFLDEYRPWEYLIIPLPTKIYLSGESAETLGQEQLDLALKESKHHSAPGLVGDIESRRITFCSTAMLSNAYKTGLRSRGVPAAVEAVYSRMQMPRWIWVVEATYRDARDLREPSVVAEAIVDATDHLRDLRCLAWRVPGEISRWLPDVDVLQHKHIAGVPLLPSVAAGCQAVGLDLGEGVT